MGWNDGWSGPSGGREHEAGFSLLELMMSILAAVVILGAILSSTLRHAAERRVNTELNLALVACTSTLEEMRTIPFADLPTLDGSGFDVPGTNGGPGGLQPLPGDGDGLPGQISVTVDQTDGTNVIYLARATVVWDGATGHQRLNLETFITER